MQRRKGTLPEPLEPMMLITSPPRRQGHALEHFVTAIAFMQVLDFKFVHAVGSHKNSGQSLSKRP
jgi:hypothetical protein